MRSHWLTLALALASAACLPDQTGPGDLAGRPVLDETQHEGQGPPPPHDFGPDVYRIGTFTGQGITEPGLSCQGATTEARQCSGFLSSAVDGSLLDISVMIPPASGLVPLVVLIHGWGGSKSSSGDIALELLKAGYAVLRYSTRGFGDSWGQVNLADLHAEIADLRSIVGQVVDHSELGLDPGAIAVTGASYGGGHAWLAALTPIFESPGGATVHIRTIVPIAAWTDLLYSLIPNGRVRRSIDRPGGLKLSYANGLYFSGIRQDLERAYPNYADYLVAWHAWMNAVEPTERDPVYRQIEDGLAGYRSVWWQQEFWRTVAATRLPILQVQGFTDDLFPLPEAARMLLALRSVDPTYPISSYFGDIGHPRASNKTGEIEYVLDLIRRWLDYYLKGLGSTPPHVIHAAITRPREEPFDASNVITVSGYEQLADAMAAHVFDEDALLVNPVDDPLSGFYWDPLVMEGSHELEPLPPPPDAAMVETSLAVYRVPVAKLARGSPLLIAGQPAVSLHASTAAHRVQLNVRLFDVTPGGSKQLITRGTYTLDSGSPLLPLGDVDVTIPTYGNLWRAPVGHMLRLEITNLDSPYITPSRVPSATEISSVTLSVPMRTTTQ